MTATASEPASCSADATGGTDATVGTARRRRRRYKRLTAEIVTIARRRANEGERVTEIANDFGVNSAALRSAVAGRIWKHLDDEAPPRPLRVRLYRTLPSSLLPGLARSIAGGKTLMEAARVAGVPRDSLVLAFARQFIADVKARDDAPPRAADTEVVAVTDLLNSFAENAARMLAALPTEPGTPFSDPQTLGLLRTVLFRGAAVDAETVTDLIPVYDGLIDELHGHAETILDATLEDRARVPPSDIEILKQARVFLERQRTRRVAPDPALLRAAARRLAGVVPPKLPQIGSCSDGERRVLTAYFTGQALLDERGSLMT